MSVRACVLLASHCKASLLYMESANLILLLSLVYIKPYLITVTIIYQTIIYLITVTITYQTLSYYCHYYISNFILLLSLLYIKL